MIKGANHQDSSVKKDKLAHDNWLLVIEVYASNNGRSGVTDDAVSCTESFSGLDTTTARFTCSL